MKVSESGPKETASAKETTSSEETASPTDSSSDAIRQAEDISIWKIAGTGMAVMVVNWVL